MQRDEFPEITKRAIAARAAFRCSNPDCRAPTAGPQMEAGKALNLGVAAHISAAATGGPRYDPALSSEQRSDIGNAIWLCQNCAKLVDNDPQRFTFSLLVAWKRLAEAIAQAEVGKTQGNHAIGIQEKWVDSEYITRVTRELEAEGYTVNLRSANDEAKLIDFGGWEHAIFERDGARFLLKIRDLPILGGYMVLLKKRSAM
jgi:hypothetical protein